MTDLELSLEGPDDQIEVQQLLTASQSLVDLLSAASLTPLTWRVSRLSTGSLHVSLRAVERPAEAEAAVSVVRGGLTDLRRRAAIPASFTPAMVRTAARLAGVVGVGGVSGISLAAGDVITVIDQTLAAHAAEALADKTHSVGAARGVLDRLSLRGRREVGLIDRGSRQAITCTFPDVMQAEVIGLIGEEVLARGRLTRNSAGQKTRLELWSLRRVDRGVPVPVGQLVGVLGSDWTEGVNSVDYVRTQRAENR